MYLDFQKHQPLHTWIKVQDEKFKKVRNNDGVPNGLLPNP